MGPMQSTAIRLADPDRDAADVASIYAPAVEMSIATFEEVAPTAEQMASRMRRTLARTPWLVAEVAGDVIGYAYAGPHHERPGYRWSVNVSVYLRTDAQGHGIGRRLYDELFAILRRQGYVNIYAGVALPNPASEALHRSMGMEAVAVYRRVGHKFGAWHDVAWFGLRLTDPPGTPPEPVPLPELRGE